MVDSEPGGPGFKTDRRRPWMVLLRDKRVIKSNVILVISLSDLGHLITKKTNTILK